MVRSIAVAMCGLFLLVACGTQPIDATHVASNRAIIKQCRDQNCVGGFIKRKTSDEIQRIDLCHYNCGPYEVSWRTLIDMEPNDGYLNGIELIVVPSDPNWKQWALAYAKQFVRK
jgi:hypothetical protein